MNIKGMYTEEKHNTLQENISTVLEKVKSNDPIYRKERGKFHIRKFNTFYNVMNRNPGLGSF